MSDSNDNSIPVLNEILVPGRAPQSRDASGATVTPAAQPAPGSAAQVGQAAQAGTQHEPVGRQEPAFAPPPAHPSEPALAPEPVLAPQPVLTPEELASPEPVLAPEPLSESRSTDEPVIAPAPQAGHPAAPVSAAVPEAEFHQPHVADHTHAKKHPRPHRGIHARHGHDDLHEDMEVSPGVFDRGEPGVPLEAGATVPPDFDYEAEHGPAHDATHDTAHEAAQSQPELDADVIAERLRGRFAGFLAGDGRGIIEVRCRDALQQHTSLLVGQITTEVARALEAEMAGWVREAVADEIARRSGRD
ncbi:DUF2486 family protein [Paraburkholderia sp. ZP32-5]|uniref:DUF2486 family protein n=1 Tax=Paraburkholderia sp. ZP32-5 TaxID=2883245 RepID=UPI001F1F048E|nr:DUF2486 family protein [Paraburkholderia sp. ZP32-5]